MAPTELTATAVSASEIDLSWTNNSQAATGITILRSNSGDIPVAITGDPIEAGAMGGIAYMSFKATKAGRYHLPGRCRRTMALEASDPEQREMS